MVKVQLHEDRPIGISLPDTVMLESPKPTR